MKTIIAIDTRGNHASNKDQQTRACGLVVGVMQLWTRVRDFKYLCNVFHLCLMIWTHIVWRIVDMFMQRRLMVRVDSCRTQIFDHFELEFLNVGRASACIGKMFASDLNCSLVDPSLSLNIEKQNKIQHLVIFILKQWESIYLRPVSVPCLISGFVWHLFPVSISII